MGRGMRLYRGLLRLLPRWFRARHGAALEEQFAESLREAEGPWRRLAVWGSAIVDVGKGAVVLRYRAARGSVPAGRIGAASVAGLTTDLRWAFRHLWRSPGFAVVAVLTVGLGIGAVTIVFSAVNGVLLRPLPFADSDRIGILWHELGDGAQNLPALHPLDIRDYEARAESFEAVTLASGRELVVTGEAGPELVDAGTVAADFFPFLGVDAALGRLFRESEDVENGPAVAVLSHGFWQRRYGGDPGVVGRTLRLNDEPYEVVGVLPRDFRLLLPPEAFLLRDSDVYLPARIAWGNLPPRNFTGFTGLVRLRPGVSWERAQAELESLAAELRAEHAVHASANTRARVVPLHDEVVKEVRGGLYILLAAVGLVLVVACANVAGLFLVRAQSSQRQLAVMAALGAGRGRLAWHMLAEAVAVAAAGALVGVGLAYAGLGALTRVAASDLPRLDVVSVDTTALVVVAALTVLTALLFGMAPALSAARTDAASSLQEGGRTGESRRQRRARHLLVLAEVALSVMLLIGTGLMLRSFAALQDVRPGFRPEGVLTFRMVLPRTPEYDEERRRVFFDELPGRLAALPGVISVSGMSQLPLTGSGPLQPFAYDEETAQNWESVTADQRVVLPDFLGTLGVELLAGRGFTAEDRPDGRPVILIDETLAAMAWPGQDAVGRQLQIGAEGPDRLAEVVGVVRHLRLHDLAEPRLPQIYWPYAQAAWRNIVMMLRVEGDPASLAGPVRAQVAAIDPELPVQQVRTLDSVVADALGETRFNLVLMLAFGGMALLLVAVGLYGVISYTVQQRRREIGLRMALGETPGDVRRRTVGYGVGLVALSCALGLIGAFALSRLIAGSLYGVRATDPLTYAAVPLLLISVAALATWLPARRATRIDPAETLRSE